MKRTKISSRRTTMATEKGKSKRNGKGRVKRKISPGRIIQYGKVAFSVFWDSGNPGAGADYERVFRWRNKYAVRYSTWDTEGPFDSLRKAITVTGLNRISTTIIEVSSDELTSEQLAKILRCPFELPSSLRINNEIWVPNQKKKFVRSGD
jgi:hypothetical protein